MAIVSSRRGPGPRLSHRLETNRNDVLVAGRQEANPAVGDAVLLTKKPVDLRVAVQDPCHLRHVQRVHEATRTVLGPFVRELVGG